MLIALLVYGVFAAAMAGSRLADRDRPSVAFAVGYGLAFPFVVAVGLAGVVVVAPFAFIARLVRQRRDR